MIANLKELLFHAKENKYAVGAFNVYNYETIRGVLEAVKEKRQPAIIAFGEKYLENMELKEVVNLVRTMTVDISTPVAIHLDHCKSIDIIKKAIAAGFTSVMYDGSELSYEENIQNTKYVVDIAHQSGVSVEAELGSIKLGLSSNEDEGEEIYTDPLQAKRFVHETNVDCLAVSIGTVHGLYSGEPKVSIERLIEIKNEIDIPFVLHGGSGTPLNIIHRSIEHGITKINVNTEISYSVLESIKNLIEHKKNLHFSQISKQAVLTAKQTVMKYMDMFQPNH
jgi:fructose-bisphosphate aldolase, class II